MKSLLMLVSLMLAVAATSAWADWAPGDGYKMHFPQLPDEDGWDVNATRPKILADDFTCTWTGPITDIHFWGSWKGGVTGMITNVHLSIHSNIANGPNGYSVPGGVLWYRDLEPQIRPIDPQTMEGWFDPNTGLYNEDDHRNYFQYNMFIPESQAFHQIEGTVYWLDIQVTVADPVNTHWGWKNADVDKYPAPFTGKHYMDDAVWADWTGTGPLPNPSQWHELIDPLSGESLDLAFVITPEPAAFVLLVLGSLALLRRR